MSMHSDIKIWKLTPGQFNQVLQNPGMDLGPPHKIEKPRSIYIPELFPASFGDDHAERVRRGHENRAKKLGKKLISRKSYKQDRAAGMTDEEIAKKYRIKLETLKGYKSQWRKKSAN